jgi:hypothetical protein
MEKFINDLLGQMHIELQKTAIEVEADNYLQLAERSFYIVESYMEKLKEFISPYQFKYQEEEIRFFKEIKPMFQKELFYFNELFSIERDKPIGSKKKQEKYYGQCLIGIELFFDRNQDLYNYYRTNKTYSDEIYFLRKTSGHPHQLVYTHDLDRNFSTPYSITLSKLQAFEQLREFLLRFMERTTTLGLSVADEKQKRNTTWTDSKAALIELAYAIHAKGSVNFGNISIKQLVGDLESFFNIRLGNVYTVVLGMGIRKKTKTPYLHGLIDSLENWLDDKDE